MRLVLTPELIVRAIRTPTLRPTLDAWRDGTLCPVVNPELLQRYLKLLRRSGLSAVALRRWVTWLSTPPHSDYQPTLETNAKATPTLCTELALRTQASGVLHTPQYTPPIDTSTPWISTTQWTTQTEDTT